VCLPESRREKTLSARKQKSERTPQQPELFGGDSFKNMSLLDLNREVGRLRKRMYIRMKAEQKSAAARSAAARKVDGPR